MLDALDLQAVVIGLFLALGAVTLTSQPAYACHEPTGWCCTVDDDGHSFCCFHRDGDLVLESCRSYE